MPTHDYDMQIQGHIPAQPYYRNMLFPNSDPGQLETLKLLVALVKLKLISPENYADILARHIDPHVQIQYEMDKMSGFMQKQLQQVFIGMPTLQKATGEDLDRLMEMTGLSAQVDDV